MQSVENLSATEAVAKMRGIIEPAPVCMFASNLSEIPFHVCPMYAQEVDAEGCLWFFSGADSEHNAHLKLDPRVQIVFCNGDKSKFLTVYGRAWIERGLQKTEELWSPMVKAWFPGGKGDPNLTLLRVEPERVHYWDTRGSKLGAMGKILWGAVTGREPQVGVEGDLQT